MAGIDLGNLTEEQAERLDGLVHDTASQVASDANNNGKQIDFLLSIGGWSLSDIADALNYEEH